MTPNGTLMAYSTPVDIKELRDQATVVSMKWREEEKLRQGLETLTIEFKNSNVIVRALQRNLLLVLVGAPSSNRPDDFIKVTPEARGDTRYPPTELPEPDESSSGDPMEGTVPEEVFAPGEDSAGKHKLAYSAKPLTKTEKDIKLGLLHIQRRRLETLTDYVQAEFKAKGFVMPPDPGLA